MTKQIALIAVSLALLLVSGCGKPESSHSGKMQVAASIGPMGAFARAVGGEHVEVNVLVSPGSSPHTYQLDPGQMAFLSKASVLVLNGLGLEFWADKAVDAAANNKLVVIHTAEGLTDLEQENHHGQPETNPHVWLDPLYAVDQITAVREAFSQADPQHTEDYRANAEAYIQRLRDLDLEIQNTVKTFRFRDFVAYHPAWTYFAKRYGLHQAAVIEESPGKEPSAAHVRDVIDTVKRVKASAVFAEPQLSPKAAEVVAAETGARVLYLDPLGKPPDYDYFKLMRDNLNQMAEALW